MFKLITILLLGLGVFIYSILDKAKQYEKHYKQIAIPYEIDTIGTSSDYLDSNKYVIEDNKHPTKIN
jgi:hypothetical protein